MTIRQSDNHMLRRRRGGLLATVSLLAAGLAATTSAAAAPADLLIHGGEIYTGEDRAPFVGDVAITRDRITYVGPAGTSAPRARKTIDAQGMAVLPGLIDAHAHPETYILSPVAHERLNAPWLMQGVSTVFTGVDGNGAPDVAAAARRLTAAGIGTNVAPYVGFGAIRKQVLGETAREITPAELDQEKALVAKGMCEGAIGLSTGLFYVPQNFAKTDEVIALAREAAVRGGIFDTHQRDESSYTVGLMNSIAEVIRIGREAHIPVHFAHLKALEVDVQGMAPQIVATINKARAEGVDVTADQYPWLASGTYLMSAVVPAWALEGGTKATLARFDDPQQLARIRAEGHENIRRRGGADTILLTTSNHAWTGKRLSEVALEWKLDPTDAAIRILKESPQTLVASFNMAQSDVDLIMQQPWVVTSSDGTDGHPRQFATFPEKYRKYVVDRRVISFGDFVRQSTGRTADIFHLDHRGYLRTGDYADVLVLDRSRYAPKADYVHPRELSVGVRDLVVNGKLAVQDYAMTGVAAGRVLLHSPPQATCRTTHAKS